MMAEHDRQYVSDVNKSIDLCRSALDIQHLLEREYQRLDDLGKRSPELRTMVDHALENRRAYVAQEPL